jgi:hypothetical protein
MRSRSTAAKRSTIVRFRVQAEASEVEAITRTRCAPTPQTQKLRRRCNGITRKVSAGTADAAAPTYRTGEVS